MASLQRQWRRTPLDPAASFDPEALLQPAPPFHFEEEESLPAFLLAAWREAPGLPLVRTRPDQTTLMLTEVREPGVMFSSGMTTFELLIRDAGTARAITARLTNLSGLLDDTDMEDELACTVMIGHTALIAQRLNWNAEMQELLLSGEAPVIWLPEIMSRRQWRSLSALRRLCLPVTSAQGYPELAGTPQAGHDELGRRLIGLGTAPVQPRAQQAVAAVIPASRPPAAPEPAISTEDDEFELWDDGDSDFPTPATVTQQQSTPSPEFSGKEEPTEDEHPWDGWNTNDDSNWSAGQSPAETDPQPDPDQETAPEPTPEPTRAQREPDIKPEVRQTHKPDQRFTVEREEPFMIPVNDDPDDMDDMDDMKPQASEHRQTAGSGASRPEPATDTPAQTSRTPAKAGRTGGRATPQEVAAAAVRAGITEKKQATSTDRKPDLTPLSEEEDAPYNDPALRAPAKTAELNYPAMKGKKKGTPKQNGKDETPDFREIAQALGFALERLSPRMVKLGLFVLTMIVSMLLFLFFASR